MDDFQKSGDHGVFYRQTATSFFQTFGYDEDYQKSVDPATPLESLKPRDLESIKDEAEREQEGAFRAGLIDKLRLVSADISSRMPFSPIYVRFWGIGFATRQGRLVAIVLSSRIWSMA